MNSFIGYPIWVEARKMCGCGPEGRSFLTKEEKVESLQEYKEALEKEVKGVAERIKELQG